MPKQDNTDRLVDLLLDVGLVVPRAQAEQLAILVAGSVEAYIIEIERSRQQNPDPHA